MKATTKTVKKINIVKKPVVPLEPVKELPKELPETLVTKEPPKEPVVKELPSYRLFHFDVLNMSRMELDGSSDNASISSDDSSSGMKRKNQKATTSYS